MFLGVYGHTQGNQTKDPVGMLVLPQPQNTGQQIVPALRDANLAPAYHTYPINAGQLQRTPIDLLWKLIRL